MSAADSKSHKKLLLILLFAMGSVFSFFTYFEVIKPHLQMKNQISQIKLNGLMLPEPQEVSHFQLMDHTGKSFSDKNLQGHWTFLFFGFTNCGMVCPTSLAALNEMYKTLQKELPDKNLPQVVFISVDPERDTQKRLNEYINSFNPHFIGARADIADIVKIEQQFHIAAAKIQADGQGKDQYTINHTAEILVINPQGKLQALLSYPHQATQLVKDYKSLLMTATS